MAAFSPVSSQCSCEDTDIDPDRIASVLKLANRISNSWDLGRPLHRLTDIDPAQITATPVRGAYTFTPSPESPETPLEHDEVCFNSFKRSRVPSNTSSPLPSKKSEGDAKRHLLPYGYLMETSSLEAYIYYFIT